MKILDLTKKQMFSVETRELGMKNFEKINHAIAFLKNQKSSGSAIYHINSGLYIYRIHRGYTEIWDWLETTDGQPSTFAGAWKTLPKIG